MYSKAHTLHSRYIVIMAGTRRSEMFLSSALHGIKILRLRFTTLRMTLCG